MNSWAGLLSNKMFYIGLLMTYTKYMNLVTAIGLASEIGSVFTNSSPDQINKEDEHPESKSGLFSDFFLQFKPAEKTNEYDLIAI